jgi:hypothetical protein
VIEPDGPPQGQNVISFSLSGKAPFYAYGAMINLVTSRTVYPDWTCRFYVAADVPRPCVAYLRENGADVRNIEDEYPGVGLFQRFLVMNDHTVGRFLVRDCDARLSVAEADLVRQWIESGYPFHIMRDHVLHNELMNGCLLAGRTDCGIDIVALMRRYFTAGPNAKIRPRPAHARPHAVAAHSHALWCTINITALPACIRSRCPIRKATSAPATRTSPQCLKRWRLVFRACCKPNYCTARLMTRFLPAGSAMQIG